MGFTFWRHFNSISVIYRYMVANMYRLMHAFFHIRTVIIPSDRPEGFITYFNIELKRTKFTSNTDTKLIWIWVINIGWGLITVLLWKKWCIDLFIERLDIVLSDFCPDICPWADIAVALPVFTYGQNWRYYLLICDKYLLQTHIIYVQISSVLNTCHLRHEIHYTYWY